MEQVGVCTLLSDWSFRGPEGSDGEGIWWISQGCRGARVGQGPVGSAGGFRGLAAPGGTRRRRRHVLRGPAAAAGSGVNSQSSRRRRTQTVYLC